MMDRTEFDPLVAHHQPKEDLKAKLVVYALLILLNYDFMSTFLTIYPYWLSLGGDSRLYGLIIGLYGGMQAVGAPVLGLLADKIGEKISILLALTFTLSGNLCYFLTGLYSSATIAGGTQSKDGALSLIYAARILAGFGSAALVLVLRNMVTGAGNDPAEHVKVMNTFRMMGLIARIASPTIATIFLYTPAAHMGSLTLNYATIPVLITICLTIIVFICTVLFFSNRPSQHDTPTSLFFWREPELQSISFRVFMLNLLITMLLTAVWAIMSQLIPICLFVYGIITGTQNLWLPYIPLIIGSLVTGILLKRVRLEEFHMIFLALLGLILSIILFMPFSTHPSEWLFYVGASFFFLFNTAAQTVMRGIYSRIIGISRYIGVLLSLLFISNGVAQLIGSSIAGAIVTPEYSKSWFPKNNCSLADKILINNVSYVNPYACNVNCTILPSQWANDDVDWNMSCYDLKNYVGVIAFSMGFCVLTAILFFAFHKRIIPPAHESHAINDY